MKKIWFLIIVILSTGCFIQITKTVQSEMAEEISPKVLRFHVRANSESDEDQELKMQVKKEVLEYLQPLLYQVTDVEEGKARLEHSLEYIRYVTECVINDRGFYYDVNVAVKEEQFPRKVYGDCTFPAGRYEALVIELGKGKGHNWWCMLYPGLCFVDESYAVVPEEGKEELKEVLSEDAYEWIVDPKYRKITVQWERLRKVLEFVL